MSMLVGGPDSEARSRGIRHRGGDVIKPMMCMKKKVDPKHPQWEERFRSAFETAGHGMAIVGLDGRFLEVNKAWMTITGYSRSELLGMDYQSITHSQDSALHVAC